jgi:hypothetical protein
MKTVKSNYGLWEMIKKFFLTQRVYKPVLLIHEILSVIPVLFVHRNAYRTSAVTLRSVRKPYMQCKKCKAISVKHNKKGIKLIAS